MISKTISPKNSANVWILYIPTLPDLMNLAILFNRLSVCEYEALQKTPYFQLLMSYKLKIFDTPIHLPTRTHLWQVFFPMPLSHGERFFTSNPLNIKIKPFTLARD